jgi:hypothetical protein
LATKYVSGTAKAKISRFMLTVDESGLTVDDKPYDGTKTANVYGALATGVFAGDNVTFLQSGTFATAKATGDVQDVTYKYLLNSDIHNGGTLDSANYTLNIKGGKLLGAAQIY